MKRYELFGLYLPRETLVHKAPAWSKLLLVFFVGLPVMIVQQWWLSLFALVLFGMLLLLARVPLRQAFGLGWGFVILIVFLITYSWWSDGWLQALTLSTGFLACIYAGRLIGYTTPGPALVDTLVSLGRPLTWTGLGRFGITPERFGLAVGLVLRSVPYILGAFSDVRDAARARGADRNVFAQVTPVAVRSVGYAYATGDALAARGLGDDVN